MDEYIQRQTQWFFICGKSVTEEQRSFLSTFLLQHPDIKNVLEVGFNGGLSSAAMLSARPDITVTSVDVAEWNYVDAAKKLTDELFPGRHTLLLGDSMKVLQGMDPAVHAFDLAFVDGGHVSPVPQSDMKYIPHLVKQGAYIISTGSSSDVVDAWASAVADGSLIQESVRSFSEDDDRQWFMGRTPSPNAGIIEAPVVETTMTSEPVERQYVEPADPPTVTTETEPTIEATNNDGAQPKVVETPEPVTETPNPEPVTETPNPKRKAATPRKKKAIIQTEAI